MTLSLDTAYRSFGGEVEASSTPTICRLPDSRRHQLSAIAPDAGRDFLHVARSILEQVDSLVTKAHRTGRGETGRLTIGFYTSLTAGNLRATLVDYARRVP